MLLFKNEYRRGFSGQPCSSVVLFVFVLPFIIGRFDLKYLSKDQWEVIVAFAVPFLPAGLFAMLMEVADRYILKILTNLETVGIYSAGYKVGINAIDSECIQHGMATILLVKKPISMMETCIRE